VNQPVEIDSPKEESVLIEEESTEEEVEKTNKIPANPPDSQ
jgi:hypothetical protein